MIWCARCKKEHSKDLHKAPLTSNLAPRGGGAAAGPAPPLGVAPLQRQTAEPGPLQLDLLLPETERQPDGDSEDEHDTVERLRRQVAACEDVNSSMYQFMVDKVMKEIT